MRMISKTFIRNVYDFGKREIIVCIVALIMSALVQQSLRTRQSLRLDRRVPARGLAMIISARLPAGSLCVRPRTSSGAERLSECL